MVEVSAIVAVVVVLVAVSVVVVVVEVTTVVGDESGEREGMVLGGGERRVSQR